MRRLLLGLILLLLALPPGTPFEGRPPFAAAATSTVGIGLRVDNRLAAPEITTLTTTQVPAADLYLLKLEGTSNQPEAWITTTLGAASGKVERETRADSEGRWHCFFSLSRAELVHTLHIQAHFPAKGLTSDTVEFVLSPRAS